MNVQFLYKGLSDWQRLRILNLLYEGPLCVCHLMEILEEDQVKISKQLRYMKELGLVEGTRRAQWMIYSLVEAGHPLIRANIESIRELRESASLRRDLEHREKIVRELREESAPCAGAILEGTL